VSTRILHVSDLHLGARKARQDATFGLALAALIERVDPALILVSGDLAHRGRMRQLAEAADFLGSLGRPILVVPGNHDLPLLPPARLTHPWREFERQFGSTEPVHSSAQLQVVGLNSVTPFRHQGGRVDRAQLARAVTRLGEAAPGACRVVVLHHHILGAPWRSRKRPLSRRGVVLPRLVEAGAELVVGGHIHQVTVSEGREFEVEHAGVLIATAPGLTRPRPRRRGEACGALGYTIEPDAVEVETYLCRQPGFELCARRRFGRAGGRLDAVATAGAEGAEREEAAPEAASSPEA
jgi:3',5'-cyclic AMP phosphodiesterase CpdA